jgi:hypothetical protein
MRKIGIAFLAATLAGCAGASSSSRSTTSAAAASAATSPAAQATTTARRHHRLRTAAPKPVAPVVTGFGATTAAWNSAHTAVSGFTPGTVYNADPSLPQVNGHEGSEYYAVQHMGGYVLQYDRAFANVPVSEAKAEIMQGDFPSDARIVWFVTEDTCAKMLVQSNILGKALGNKAVGDPSGTAMVEFGSGPASDSYDASSVNDALFMTSPMTSPAGEGPC